MLRYSMSSCTSSHTWCYATVSLLALPHIHDATLLHVFLHFLTYMMLRYCKSSCTSSHTSLFQKTAKVLNETAQSRWLSLAIEKNARRNVLKPAYFKKTAKKWRWFWKLMNAENIAKRKKKAKTQWHGEYHELNCLPKPCVSHPMSSIWTPRTDKTWVQFPTRRDVLDEYKPHFFRGPITPLVKTHHAKLPFAIAALARDFWHG